MSLTFHTISRLMLRKLIGGGSEGGTTLATLAMKMTDGDEFARSFLKAYILRSGCVSHHTHSMPHTHTMSHTLSMSHTQHVTHTPCHAHSPR